MTITKEQLKILKALYDLGFRYMLCIESDFYAYNKKPYLEYGLWMTKSYTDTFTLPFFINEKLKGCTGSDKVFPFYKLFEKEDK